MTSQEVINMLIQAFGLIHAEARADGEMIYGLDGEQTIWVQAWPGNRVRLHVPLEVPADSPATLLRLLEANCQGVETGSCRMALDPMGEGVALVDFLTPEGLDLDQVQMRIVDLLLYADYWTSEVSPLAAPVQPAGLHLADMTTFRV